ncbi:MAG: COX15/CtaA family protein [Thermoplasmatota archaeon]
MQTRLAWVRRLAVTCIALTFLLMVLGAWVKANGAGLSCPDWPACYGRWIPPFPAYENGGSYHGQPVAYTEAQELYEWTHRAVVACLFVPLVAWAWQARKDLHPGAARLPAVAVGLYFVQAALGAVTVVTGNPPWATTAHLATAVLFMVTQVVAASFAFLRPFPPAPPVIQVPQRTFVWENPQPVLRLPVAPPTEGPHGK